MDELAALGCRDPLEFRLALLELGRVLDTLEEAARRFDCASRSKKRRLDIGFGLTCGLEKG